MRRTLITMLLVASSLAVVFALSQYGKDPKPDGEQPPETKLPVATGQAETPTAAPAEVDTQAEQPPAPQPAPAPTETPATDNASQEIGKLIAIDPGDQPEPVIGSSDEQDNPYKMRVEFSKWNAGIAHLELADYSDDALEHIPYPVQSKLLVKTTSETDGYYYYPFGAKSVTINDQTLVLNYKQWELLTDPLAQNNDGEVRYQLTIAESAPEGEQPKPLLRLERTFRVLPGRYDLQLEQKVVNLTDRPLVVQFEQYGPGDMAYRPSYMGDRRGMNVAYADPEYDPNRMVKNFKLMPGGQGTPRKKLMAEQPEGLWPNKKFEQRAEEVLQARRSGDVVPEQYEVAFVAMTNRYFAAAAIPLMAPAPEGQPTTFKALNEVFPTVGRVTWGQGERATLLLTMESKRLSLAAGGEASLDVALFAGPKSQKVFDADPVYTRLGFEHLVVYETGCCLSFNGIAKFMHWLLDLFHVAVRDWGLAIIVLTLIVRAILHPITKKSQLNMMRFAKQMQTLQPEIEKLKKKHKDDSQKLNQEMMKLYREKNVNPAGMAMGCLPMFLQTPIWIALWAMLFYAIDLRHTPAFFDFFHRTAENLGYVGWRFLTDLADKDRFIPLPESVHFSLPVIGKFEAINLLPIMLMFTYWAQQKFMQPPQTTELSDQAKTQQKIMKFMLLSFPVILFNAPSGLTLYMLASSISGIIDGKIVRKKLKQMEERGEFDKPRPRKAPKPGGFLDRMQKAAEAKQREMQEMQRRQAGGGKGKKRRR